ncbi:MAG: stage II sporulation protein M [Deltaproteobacteria bacterium]
MAQSIRRFIETRRARWEKLETTIQSLERGRLNDSEIVALTRLYREATADLARLQAFQNPEGLEDDLESYLNHLVARAYSQIYRSSPPRMDSLWRFLRSGFPAAFRETLAWTLFAFGVFSLGMAYGFITSISDSGFAALIVPPQLIQNVEAETVWFDSILAVKPLASSMIMTNNISVSFLAFAMGMTFGLGTLYLMVFNGLMVGTLAGLCYTHGLSVPFWSFVLPHGVIELTAIFMAGGAGFLLGGALLFPGDLPRKDALLKRARQAGRLILGCVPLLLIAGIVEGFFSPIRVHAGFKFGMAGLLLGLLLCYLFLPRATGAPVASRPGNVP